MLYVLDQRLVAQNITAEKADKVMCDVVNVMFDVDYFDEMAKPQITYSKEALRGIFKKIVHSSIMKINSESMEKLYDLMVMSVKYQILHCNTAQELLHITLNHLDAALEFVAAHVTITEKIKKIFHRLVEMYGNLTVGDYALTKQALLNFFQNSNNKVSVYLTLKQQNDKGRFVVLKEGEMPEGYDVPGTIKLFRKVGPNAVNTVTSEFKSGCNFQPFLLSSTINASNDISGTRCTTLGENVYKNEHALSACNVANNNSLSSGSKENSKYAKAELGLLAQMIGSDQAATSQFEFKLSLFPEPEDVIEVSRPGKFTAEKDNKKKQPNVVNITPTTNSNHTLSQIVEDLTINPNSKPSSIGEDLLSLMDS